MLTSYQHPGETALPSATRIVRPDRAYFDVTLAVETDSATAAVSLFERLLARAQPALGAGAQLEVLDFDVAGQAGKLVTPTTRLRARVTVALEATAPVFSRAARVAAVEDVLRAFALEAKRQKPAIEVHLQLPSFGLADPEAQRAALVEQWQKRARMVAGEGKLTLRGISFDRAIEQRSRGLEQVELLLPLEGTAEVAF